MIRNAVQGKCITVHDIATQQVAKTPLQVLCPVILQHLFQDEILGFFRAFVGAFPFFVGNISPRFDKVTRASHYETTLQVSVVNVCHYIDSRCSTGGILMPI